MMRQTTTINQDLEFKTVARAVIYARVSGDDRKNEGLNLKSQLDMCREYAQENNYQIVAELAEDDRGASGAAFNLPELSKITTMAEAGQFDILIVREIDRLSRSLAKQLIVEEDLRRHNVSIEYVLADYENTPEGNLNKHLRATIAEYEREKIRERIIRGRYNKARAGYVVPHKGLSPYAYELVNQGKGYQFAIVEEQAQVVRMMFQWYVIGDESGDKLSLEQMAKRLNKMGIATQNNKKWIPSTIRGLLKNETYAGTWHYGKKSKNECIPVEVPAIIERALWEQAQEQLEKNKQYAKRNRREGQYLLSSLCTCGHCQGNMRGKTRKHDDREYVYYLCDNRECPNKNYRARLLEAKVWEWVEETASNRDRLIAGLKGYQDGQQKKNEPLLKESDTINALIDRHSKQLEETKEAMRLVSGAFAKAQLAEEAEQIKKLLDGIESRKRDVMSRITENELTDQDIISISDFTVQVAEDIQMLKEAELAGKDNEEARLKVFNAKRKLLDVLNIQIKLYKENGKQKASVTAFFCPDGYVLSLEFSKIHYTTHNRQKYFTLSVTIEL